jgi:hypothetical protein
MVPISESIPSAAVFEGGETGIDPYPSSELEL